MRKPTPWYRAANDTWYVWLNKRQEKLVIGKKNKEEAYEVFYKLMASRGKTVVDRSLTVDGLKTIFLNWSKSTHTPDTSDWYERYIKSFCEHNGNGKLKVFEVLPYHATEWKTAKGFDKRAPLQCVKRMFSWGASEGVIKDDPLLRVKLPPIRSRVVLVSPEERDVVLKAIKDEAFRRFVFTMQQTGCRPGEIAKITAKDARPDQGIWILNKHKTSQKTGKPRIIYLTEPMIDLTKKLMLENPTGPLFTTMKRKRVNGVLVKRGFTKNGIRCRFRELRKRLPNLKQLIAYAYRHSFATEGLTKGIDIAHVAELLGNTPEVVAKHYSHLSEKVSHMRETLRKAVG